MRQFTALLMALIAGLASQACYANMASPVTRGTVHAIAISSRDINVLHEWITVTPRAGFASAGFDVSYEIETGADGQQIPLLFVARNYKGDFRVSVDGTPVPLLKVPDSILHTDRIPWSAFNSSINAEAGSDMVSVSYDGSMQESFRLSELMYFQVALSKGRHRVTVSYEAAPDLDRSAWIKQYRLAYSLSPARHWKSFGPLDITIDGRALDDTVTTSLGLPDSGSTSGLAVWHFRELPADFFQITYKPKAGRLAEMLLTITPEGLALFLAVLLVAMHVLMIIRYRKRGGSRKWSPVAIVGGIVVPLIVLVAWVYFYALIDAVIGAEASARHGYVFMILILYVIVGPLYIIAVLITDYLLKKRIGASV